MVDMITLLFICLILPLILMIPIFRGKSRTVFLFIIFGVFACFAAGEIDGMILTFSPLSVYDMTTNITPITEELLKLVPILCFAFLFRPNSQHLLECSIACGIGFALMENAYIFAQNAYSITFSTAIIRGIGAGMMHSLCTFTIGYGIVLFDWKKKWFFTGTVALIALVAIYHALYNVLIQSSYMLFGVILTALTYFVVIFTVRKNSRKEDY